MEDAGFDSKDRGPLLRRRILIGIGTIACCAVAACSIGHLLESKQKKDEPRGDLTTRFTQATVVSYNGHQYLPKTKLTTILVMGTDHEADETAAEAEDTYRNGGQADFLLLVVADAETGTITTIQIDRDTMAEITTLGVLGNATGTRITQICLAHGFGDGKEQSCLLQKEAVSGLLGVEIPYYFAMSFDGISTLNDAVGGVTVQLKDDFTALDPQMSVGSTLTLQGIQAEYYVRNRSDIGAGTNASRGIRQQAYLKGLATRIDERLREEDDTGFLNTILGQLESYMTTNLTRGRIINEIWKDKDYDRLAVIRPTGEYRIGDDGFMEFYADESDLQQTVLNVFYTEVS